MNNSLTRLKVINIIAAIIIIIIVCRVVYLNTYNTHFLSQQINFRIMRNVKDTAFRGTIVDRHNNPLAISTPVDSIWADPSAITDKTQLQKIAQILNMSIDELNNKINQPKTFVYLRRAVTPYQADKIKYLNIGGIYSTEEFKRFYPNREVTAHVVGFTNIDDEGSEGIEYAKNSQLTGVDGSKQVIRDRQGHIVENLGYTKQKQNGQDINLSIDNQIQYIAFQALKEQVLKSEARGGAITIIDAKNGQVLAMVNMPTYNPNNRAGVSLNDLRNRAAIDIYEPGSIIKPLLVAKALDVQMVKSNTIFDTHPFYVKPKIIKDNHNEASMTVTNILVRSSDIGMSKIGLMFRPQDMWDFYNQIGFGQKVGTNFPGEAKGILRPWQKWYPIDQATMSFGYGVSVSLMQMARSYSLFTNAGCLLPISFYTGVAARCQQIIKPDVALEVRDMLALNMTDGTGKQSQLADYTSAGKTGTAHKAIAHGYAANSYYGSFVGFAPVKDPKIIVAVMIDEPKKGGYYGAIVAAPVFSKVANAALHILGIKPDKCLTN